jgi:hypothetical protein
MGIIGAMIEPLSDILSSYRKAFQSNLIYLL